MLFILSIYFKNFNYMIIRVTILIVLIGIIFFFRTYTSESFQIPLDDAFKLNTIDMSTCKASCCPSTYSCDNGCVCLSMKDKNSIFRRGNNSSDSYTS